MQLKSQHPHLHVLLLQMLKGSVGVQRRCILCRAVQAVSKLKWIKTGGEYRDHVLLYEPLDALRHNRSQCFGVIVIKAGDCGFFGHWDDGCLDGTKAWFKEVKNVCQNRGQLVQTPPEPTHRYTVQPSCLTLFDVLQGPADISGCKTVHVLLDGALIFAP